MIKRTLVLVSLLAAMLLAGCDSTPNPQALLADAKQYRAKGELKTALIQSRNAIQAAPDLAEGHLLLGAIYLELGQAILAEPELRKALELKMDPREVLPVLARSLLDQEKFQELLDETVPERFPPAARSAEIASLRGRAYLGLDRVPLAETTFKEALQYDADFPEALVGLAKITAADGRPVAGLQLVDRALVRSPSSLDALLLKGDLQRVLGNPEGALEAYEKAVPAAKLKRDELNARLTLASMQIALNKNDDVTANLAVVLKEAPESPTANYLQALVEFRKNNYAAAQHRAVQVLKVEPSHVPSVILAGTSEYMLATYPAAELHLKWVLDHYPDSLYVRKLLTATYHKTGRTQLALETLQPALKGAVLDSSVLALAGEVYTQACQFAKATQYFEMAAKIDPDNLGTRVSAGASRLAAGETERAVAELESVVAAAPGQTQASILLAMANLRRKDFDKALALATKLEQASPKNPIVRNLKGSAYVGKRDFVAARRAFEEALAIDASYFPAAANLAQLDLGENKVVAARQRYDAVLERDPKNTQAMLAIAELLARMPGTAEESIRWVEQARQLQPNDPHLALIAAKYRLAAGDRTQAVEMARQASILGESDAKVLVDAVKLQLAAGASREALDTYLKVARVSPPSADVQYRLAALQYLVVNSVVAKQTVQKALELDPNHEQALNLLAKLEAAGGNRDAAFKLVERVKKLKPNSPGAFVLEGDVEMLGKRYANAVKAYERAYSIEKSGILAAQIHQAYWRAGKPEPGEAVVLKWLEENPTDASTRTYLADTSLLSKRVAVAIPQYEWLAQNRPRDQQVLNNLAWAYDANADARALATAEAALKLDEKSAVATDTYGWMLYRNERFAEAVEVLRRAVTMAPNERDVRYHYAQALVKTGDRKNARLELERVLAGSTPFARQAEAKPLLDQLRN